MKTSKPFSTISYNTSDFLTVKLNDLIQRQVLAFWAFVYHYPEEDEKKGHVHLLCVPNGYYQTDGLREYLSEPDLANPANKPLTIKPCMSSKFGDWFLYCCHDTAYLATKCQTRKHHYSESDFVTSDSDYFGELIHTIDRSKYAKTADFVRAIQEGKTLSELVLQGQIPAPQFNQWKALYDFLTVGGLMRDGRTTHTPTDVPVYVDPLTGEVVDVSEHSDN